LGGADTVSGLDNPDCFVNPLGEKPVLRYSDYEFGEEGLSEGMQDSIESDFDYKLSNWQYWQDTLVKKLLILKHL